MKFKILGSGGMQQTPRACCTCKVCVEARKKGYPYKRRTQSLYLYDTHTIFDTPECISDELNSYNIDCVSFIFYTHFHPDHSMGCRIIEELREDKTGDYPPIIVNVPKDGINISFNGYTPILNLFENSHYCKLNYDTTTVINDIKITRIKLENEIAYGFIIEQNNKKLFYCPCHAMYIPKKHELLNNVDVMILGVGYVNYLDDTSTNFYRDNITTIENYKPTKTLFTHIEESDGLSFDDYCKIEAKYSSLNIFFAYDGMDLEL